MKAKKKSMYEVCKDDLRRPMRALNFFENLFPRAYEYGSSVALNVSSVAEFILKLKMYRSRQIFWRHHPLCSEHHPLIRSFLGLLIHGVVTDSFGAVTTKDSTVSASTMA